MTVINKKIKKEKNQKMATLCLFLATFFLPLGYDIIIKIFLDLGVSYWNIMLCFYLLSACFFGLFFWFSKISMLSFVTDFFGKTKSIISRWNYK